MCSFSNLPNFAQSNTPLGEPNIPDWHLSFLPLAAYSFFRNAISEEFVICKPYVIKLSLFFSYSS